MCDNHHEFIPVSPSIEDDRPLLCPLCGHEYVHPVEVSILPAGTLRAELAVRVDGVHIDRTRAPEGRGASTRITFACERGHVFAYRFHFHKGQTLVSKINVGIALGHVSETIWRK